MCCFLITLYENLLHYVVFISVGRPLIPAWHLVNVQEENDTNTTGQYRGQSKYSHKNLTKVE